MLLFLSRQASELGMERMIGRQKRLLTVQDRRVVAGSVIETFNLAGPERELDGQGAGRARNRDKRGTKPCRTCGA